MKTYRWIGLLLALGFLLGLRKIAAYSTDPFAETPSLVASAQAAPLAAGDIINAASCSQEDVQAAIDQAVDGDLVLVPTGNCTWTTPASQRPSVQITGKSITLQGMGIDRTVLVDGTGSAWNETMLLVDAIEGKPFRVTGFSFVGSLPKLDYFPIINLRGSNQAFRIDHCKFENVTGRDILLQGYLYGVIDHCISVKSSHDQSIYIEGDDDSWKRPLAFGTANAVYIENCDFERDQILDHMAGAVDGYNGARYVFRYNTTTNSHVFYHGAEISGARSGFSMEVYENTMIASGYTPWTQMDIWGGTAVLFDNTLIGTVQHGILLRNRRSCEAYPVFGLCDGTNPYDSNLQPNGYACLDQIGRSTDAGPETIHPQAHEPLYEWDNTMNGQDVKIDINGECPAELVHIQENRDYYNDTPRPGYTPYTNPHPLTQDMLLTASPLDGAASLDWEVTTPFAFPASTTWQIEYATSGSAPVIAASGLANSTRGYTVAGLNAGTPYTITLRGMIDDPNGSPITWASATAVVTPTGLALHGHSGDNTIFLNWDIHTTLPSTTTWTISYDGTAGDEPSPISGIPLDTRTYTLTGMTNYEWYEITLSADPSGLTDTVRIMPTDQLTYLPLVMK